MVPAHHHRGIMLYLDDTWTIDGGLLTPTKNKRASIEGRFAADIEKLCAPVITLKGATR